MLSKSTEFILKTAQRSCQRQRMSRRPLATLSASEHCESSSAPLSASIASTERPKYFRDRFSVAPMMEYTDRHQRYLFRLLSEKSVLYTEMVTAAALVYSNHTERHQRLLGADFIAEEPLVLQIGGSDRALCRQAVRIARDFGYREINLNVGCPSDRVADAGCFGAALMAKPRLVAEILQDMNDEMFSGPASQPVRPCTVKCRIGIDDQEDYEHIHKFVRIVSEQGGVTHFVVHARKAILGGRLSPDQNRSIPPLKYHFVYRLVTDFPHLKFTINGGIVSFEEIKQHLEVGGVHGVMVGRQCVNRPYYWRNVDSLVYNQSDPGLSRRDILDRYAGYAEQRELELGKRERRALIKPLFHLFAADPNGKQFRIQLDNNLKVFETTGTMRDVIMRATSALSNEVLDSTVPNTL